MELTIDQALQKGIEAHKAGQVQEAVELYVQILQEQPNHPDANHSFGDLIVGVGKVQEALTFFKTALEANPGTAQFWLSYIDALIKLDRIADAKAVLDQAKDQGVTDKTFDQLEKKASTPISSEVSLKDPPLDQFQPIIDLYDQGQFQRALVQAAGMLEEFPNSVIIYNILGATNAGLGQFDAAIDSYKKAIKIQPDYAEGYNNLGAAQKDLGDLKAAIDSFKQALKINPSYANAYYNMGAALNKKGDLEAAINSYKKALEIQPDYADAYYNIALSLRDKGDRAGAIESFKQTIKVKSDHGNAKHLLAAITGQTTNSAPREYVESLFEMYASNFDNSLVDALEYNIPKILTDIIVKQHGNGFLGSVLDLGCGTGLTGMEVKFFCTNLEGIDLSGSMLDQARRKNLYDNLTHMDIAEYLSTAKLDFDCFISTDVFIYVGDLSNIFRLIKARNKRSGKLLFSTEHTEKDGFFLEQTGRYSHSKSYIESLCEQFGYSVSHFSKTNLRKDKGVFLTGGLYILDF